ncbi:hypothetical protein JKG47_22070 [Acidithiobacillus sp. MC6.1]|nr:hypothetical protein [Acidithiobacillus sp. MC6.1]
MEVSPVIPLLAGLNARQRGNCLSAGAMVRRQQAFGGWTGNLVMATMNRQVILDLPDLPITHKAMQSMGIPKILTTRHPDICAMLYEDQDQVAWCMRLSGPGLPVLQVDMFKTHASMAVLV